MIQAIVLLCTTIGWLPEWTFLYTPAQVAKSNDNHEISELNDFLSRDLSTDQSHWYRTQLQSNQLLRIKVTASGIGLRVTMSEEEGRVLTQTACSRSDPIHLSWIADQPEIYRLEISACETEPITGSYQVRVEEKRPVNTQDRYRVTAELATLKAEKLRAEANGEANGGAVRAYEEALRLWRAASDNAGEAATLRKIGEMLRQRGERRSALYHFKLALAVTHQIKNPQERIKILNNIGSLLIDMGDYKDALAACSLALKLSRANKNPESEAQALSNIGMTYYGLYELRKSLGYQQAALSIWQDLRDRVGQAEALLRKGYAHVVLGEIQESLSAYQRSLSLYHAVNDYQGQATVLTALGHLYAVTGGKQEALNYYNQAMPLSQRMQISEITARLYSGMGYVYYELGEMERALQYRKQALEIYHAMPEHWGESSMHLSIGRVYHSMGKEQQAIEHYQQGLIIARSLSSGHLESALLREMGAVYYQLGQKQQSLALYKQSLSLSQIGGDPRDKADALNYIGRMYADLNRKQEALSYFNTALLVARAVNDRFAQSSTLFNIARVQRDLNRLDKAREQIEAAISIVESLRINVASHDLRASYFATVRQLYELYIDVLMLLHEQRPSEGFEATAIGVSERGRARSLLEILAEAHADIRQGIDPTLMERERVLQQQLNDKAERQMRLLGGPHTGEEAAAFAKEIDEITSEYDAVKAQIRVTNPRYAALTQPHPLNLQEIQRQVLDDDTLLLEYALGDERSYLWAVTRTKINGYKLPGRVEVEGKARRLYDLLTAHQPVQGETFEQRQTRIMESDAQYWQEANALSNMILGPVEEQLGSKRLLVIADGALQYIPFGALTMSRSVGQRYDKQYLTSSMVGNGTLLPLIIEHEIVSLPSASVLAVLRSEISNRKPAVKSVAVLADPIFEKDDPRVQTANGDQSFMTPAGLQLAELHRALRDVNVISAGGSIPRLLASREEAEAIMALTPSRTGLKAVGFEANRSMATRPELGQYRIVHFATHGLLNSEHPELSGIILSLVDQHGQPQDGFLRLHDIYNLNLPVELVVLSACNTGLGKDIRGEGLVGLTRGFMYAGAAGVVASLWKVDDEATAELMKHFYRGMLKDGLSPAVALRAAQLTMWKQKQWRSPYFWAAFTLQGEYRQKVNIDYASQQGVTGLNIIVAGTMILVLSLIGLSLMKLRSVPR